MASSGSGTAPLAGRTVVVTRARDQAGSLISALESRGAEVLVVPAIAIADPPDLEPVRRAVATLGSYQWVVFSSANAVERFLSHLPAPAALAMLKIAAVGTATAEKLAAHGVKVDLVPAEFRAEWLVEAFLERGVSPGARFLIPRALEGRELLPEQLRAEGAQVDVVPVYQTVAAAPEPEIAGRLRAGVDAVTFTSPSTVKHFLAALEAAGIDPKRFMSQAAAVSIGPTTSAALRDRGVEPAAEASPSTVEGLAEAVAAALSSRRS